MGSLPAPVQEGAKARRRGLRVFLVLFELTLLAPGLIVAAINAYAQAFEADQSTTVSWILGPISVLLTFLSAITGPAAMLVFLVAAVCRLMSVREVFAFGLVLALLVAPSIWAIKVLRDTNQHSHWGHPP